MNIYPLNLKRLSISLFFVLFSTSAVAGNKVTICHIPPGNPDNAHTITVSTSAVDAHMAHGDSMGECDTGGSGSSSSGSSSDVSAAGVNFTICDERVNETGRAVNVNLVGRVSSDNFQCE
jgi:hypothetical protein